MTHAALKDLLPCPFCASAAELIDMTFSTIIRCTNEQCISRIDAGGFNFHNHQADAIAAWNRRAALSAVEGEAAAWMVERDSDPSFPRLLRTEAEADSLISYCNVNPPVTKRPLIYGDTAPPPQQAVKLRDRVVRVGDLPAPITNPEAWPPNYADGFNDAVKMQAEFATQPQQED